MESRKIQRVGYSTFSISLPKEWVENTGLKQGDLIMIATEKDGSLKLIPPYGKMVFSRIRVSAH